MDRAVWANLTPPVRARHVVVLLRLGLVSRYLEGKRGTSALRIALAGIFGESAKLMLRVQDV